MSSNIEIRRICAWCKQEFIAHKTTTTCCSHRCANLLYKQKKREASIKANNQVVEKVIKEKPIAKIRDKPILTITEAATYIGVTRPTLYGYLKRGELKASRLGYKFLLKKEDIDNLFNKPIDFKIPVRDKPSINDFYTTAEVKEKYGVKDSWIFHIAKEHNISLVTRINRFFGYAWTAEPQCFPTRNFSEDNTANIIITCTDNIRSRLTLWKFLKKVRKENFSDHSAPIYWMDFGNSQTKGQVIIGTVREKVLQPSSQEYIPMPKMNVITEEVDYAKIKEKESGPSCSLAEALEKQDLFINSTLAHIGCDLLWRMFKEGKTLYRGAYVNLETLKVTAIPV